VLSLALAACAENAVPVTNVPPPPPPPLPGGQVPSAATVLTASEVPLSAVRGPVDLDYMLADRKGGKVWVPAGGTGSVVVIDAASLQARRVDGFATTVRSLAGHTFTLGPTAVALGDGVAYIGNRGDNRICAVDATRLELGACISLGAPDDLSAAADGMAYLPAARELWITRGAPTLGIMPPDSSIVVYDASDRAALKPKTKVEVPGAAEGYAVDDAHGVFYTNVVDKDLTLAVDVNAHRVRSVWHPQCGKEGPRGLGVDSARGILFVACTDHVVALDATRDGAIVGSAPVGDGIDNIDYVESRHELHVAASRPAKLAVFRFEGGAFVPVATATTARGARVVVADGAGTSFVGDPAGGRVLVFRAAGAAPTQANAALPATAPAPAPPAPIDPARVASATGGKPEVSADVVKVSFPRDDVRVDVDGWAKMAPFMGLTSWAAFVPAQKPGFEAMVMGDLVLLEDEVGPAMSAALDGGLEVTALHNHFFFDRPHVIFMHIGGEGSVDRLGAGVKATLDAVRSVRKKTPRPAAAFGAPPPSPSKIDGAALDAIFGAKGTAKDGMYKGTFGRKTQAECGCTVGKAMGVSTWAAFGGTDADAVVDGDFAVAEGELQPVLKSLRASGVNVVAIHSHMTGESPRILFLHYWGSGRAADLARAVKRALDLTAWDGRAQST
jgi:DNA-binding beta-propeller fold protein YncE